MRRKSGLALISLVIAAALAGCGDSSGPPEQIHESTGTFRGITIGDPARGLDKLVGECQDSDNLAPCGVNAETVTEPHTLPGEWEWRTFPDATFFAGPEGVKGFLVTTDSATTEHGIRVGDSLDEAKAAYTDVRCDRVIYEDDFQGPPYCLKYLPRARVILFGGDPIDSIVVARQGAG
jgi:hypothetical protein